MSEMGQGLLWALFLVAMVMGMIFVMEIVCT